MKKMTALFLALAILTLGAVAASAQTCDFNTEWGPMTIYLYDDGTLYGEYPAGTMDGSYSLDGQLDGTWYEVDSVGYFSLASTDWGFDGVWMFDTDSNWTGSLTGELIGCY